MTPIRIQALPAALRTALLCTLLASGAVAPPALSAQDGSAAAAASAAVAPPYVTQHSVVLEGETIEYEARVDRIWLHDAAGSPTAEVWYTAYHRTDVDDPHTRPLIFSFNGGPGSSSFWLHMGVMGPKRVRTPEPEHTGPAPYEIVDNPATLLDRADIVMLDPVGTGFSRPFGDTPGSEFWGVEEDAASLTQFIQRYLSHNHRWNSPKYLLGESYGTMRSAVLASTLQGANIDLNGIVLVSAVLDLQTLIFTPNDDIPYITNLPAYAVAARYHGALPGDHPDLEAFMAEVEAFAMGPYASALIRGSTLDAARRGAVLDDLVRYTGLERGVLDRADLRVTAAEFEQALFRDEGQVVGRLDARYLGTTDDPLAQNAPFDPQSYAIRGPYAGAWNHYLRTELGYEGGREYVPSGNVQPWNWEFGPDAGFGQAGLTNVAPALAGALRRNPTLEVLLVNGIYDLATPYFAAVWTMDHLGLPPELRDNIARVDFEAGHMMYVREDALSRWRDAIGAFIDRTAR